MGLVLPPNEVFLYPRLPIEGTMGGYSAQNWIRTECPPSGGMFAYYLEHPHPRKGHTYPQACEANNTVKRLTIGAFMTFAHKTALMPALGFLVTPWKWKIRFIENTLDNYLRMSEYVVRNHLLKKKFYTKAGQELWDFVTQFLLGIGISMEIAYKVGRLVAHLFEHDDAYLLRVKDIFTEMSKGHMIINPEAEIERVLKIYLSREKIGISERFGSVAKVLSVLLLVPKIRRSFVSAFEGVNMENLRLDDGDRYFARQRDDYDFMGEKVEERVQKFSAEYNKYALKRFKDLAYKAVQDPIAKEALKQQLDMMAV